jgi:HAD superfamily hydrolase (TIGR01509 family)
MTLPRRVSAVVLDMDGTLHDTETVYHTALKQAVRAVGFAVTDAFCHSLIGVPGPESDALLRAHLGPDFPFAECDRLYVEHRDRAFITSVPLKAGAVELLEALGQHGLKVAVATSASRHAASLHLGRSGLSARLPVVVTRDDVARGKPHPDVFLRAAALLGVPPVECLAVEDSLHGIRAAHAAGMMPVMVPDLLAPTEEIRTMCVLIALDLHEVRELLARHVIEFPRT